MLRAAVKRLVADQAGFSLLELLGVAIILVILSLMALPVYASITDRPRDAKSRSELREIEMTLERYKADMGHYPNRLGLLVEQGYLKETTFESPWSSPERRIYYFYAVDDAESGLAQAYALGDPGPKAHLGCDGQASTTLQSEPEPLPCGRYPWYMTGGGSPRRTPSSSTSPVPAWSFDTSSNHLTVPDGCRTPIDLGAGEIHSLRGCRSDLHTES